MISEQRRSTHRLPKKSKVCPCCTAPLGGGCGFASSTHYFFELTCDCVWPVTEWRNNDYNAPKCRLHRIDLYEGKTVDEYRAIDQENRARLDLYNATQKLESARKEVASLERQLGMMPGESIKATKRRRGNHP